MNNCPVCNSQIPPRTHGGGTPKQFCSEKCRKKQAGARRYRKDPERIKAINEKWTLANLEHARAMRNGWNKRNPSSICAASTRYAKANPEKVRVWGHCYRARKADALVPDRPVTAAMEAERKALFNGCCFCSADKKLTLEHMVPLSKGGLHIEENLLGSCLSCNSGKKDSPVEAWFREQPFFSEQRWQEIQEVCE